MTALVLNRRSLITGLISLVAAPAIVRVTSIMPVRTMSPSGGHAVAGVYYQGSLDAAQVAQFFARQRVYINGLKADGLWDKLDAVYSFDAPTEELALTNWKVVRLGHH